MDQRSRWHLAQDVALAVLVAALGLLEVWLPMESAMGDGSPTVSTLGIVVVAAFLTQRRVRPLLNVAAMAVWPVIGVATGGQLQILFLGQLVPLLLLIYSMARHGKGRQSWLGLVAGLVLLTGDLYLDLLQDLGELIFHWTFATVAFLIGRGLRRSEDRAVSAALRAAEAELAGRERAAAAVAEERARIARELHDIVAHGVSVMVVQAGAAEQVVEEDPAFARQALGTIRTTGNSALTEMRRLVAVLRAPESSDLTPQPGVASLPVLLEAAQDGGLRVDLTVTGERRELPAGLDLTAYRIVQEALTNVRRHSEADRAEVALDFGREALEIRVRDGGPARSGRGEPGHGLIGMRERAALFGGRLETLNGDGFTVHAVLPLEAR